jgi:uncharacterized protein (TIGR03437 family)
MIRFALPFVLLLLSGLAAFSQTVRFETNLGNIDVTLQPASAPKTVENFLRYVNKSAYDNTFFHRSVKNFVIQGGGFRLSGTTPQEVPQDPPVVNEYRLSNLRGTIAMAKLGDDPNSATNQWFFNTANNSAQLDRQNGGFTVFGTVADEQSRAVMDKIAALPIVALANDATGIFGEVPVQSTTISGAFFSDSNLVVVKTIRVVQTPPTISSGGVVNVTNFGGGNITAPGSYLEIYGRNLAPLSRGWAESDFQSGKAPSSLEGVSVTVGGEPAYVSYISPGQVNIQVPATVTPGQVPVVVTNGEAASAAVNITVRQTAGALLAPPIFRLNDRQFAAALHSDTNQFVSNGYIGELPAAPAKPGETLIFYGIGFGPVESGEVAGQIATGTWRLRDSVEFRFGDVPGRVDYAGLAPSLVGLYQFNVVVPAGAPAGDIPLKVLLGGEPTPQTLYITVQP